MDSLNLEKLRKLAGKSAVVIAVFLGVLAWLRGTTLDWLVVKIVISFILFYLMCTGLLTLFEKTGLAEEAPSQVLTQGMFLDVTLGRDELEGDSGGKRDSLGKDAPGQVKADLAAGLPDPKDQAEIIRRMGWTADSQ